MLVLVPLGAAETWAPPEDITPRLEATLADLVAHGFPDPRSGTLVSATLVVSGLSIDPQDRAARWIDFGNAPSDAAGALTYAGVHLRLADGGWFAGCTVPFLAGDPATVAAREVEPWRPAPAPSELAPGWVDFPALLDHLEPGLWAWASAHPIVDQITGMRFSSQPGLLVLVGQRVPGVARAVVGMAISAEVDRRLRLASGLQAGQTTLRLFPDRMLDGQNDRIADLKRVLAGGPPVTWRDLRPEAVLQAEALRWWERRLLHGTGGAPALAETKRLSALLATAVQVLSASDIERLPMTLALPVAPATSAAPASREMAERLIAWEPPAPPRRRRGKKNVPEVPPDRFTAADLPALARLVAEVRPSRWISRELSDNGIPQARTVGDNALRAMADVLHLDPRWLTGGSPEVGWDDGARRSTADALVALLPEQAPVDVPALMARALPRLPLRDVAYVLSGLTVEQRGPLLDALAIVWRTMPDSRQMPAHDDLAVVLALAGPHSGLRAAVARWGAAVGNLPAAALYLANQGDEQLLAEVAARLDPGRKATGDDAFRPGGSYYQRESLVALAAHPSPVRLTALLAAGKGDWRRELALLDDLGSAWRGEIKCLIGDFDWSWRLAPGVTPVPATWPNPPATGLAGEALSLAVMVRLLHDRTPIPAVEVSGETMSCSVTGCDLSIPLASGSEQAMWAPGAKLLAGRPAADLRVCDVAATVMTRYPYAVAWLDAEGGDQPSFDLRQPQAQREGVLVEWQRLTLERAHQAFGAAHLPVESLPVRVRGTSGNDF